MRPTTQPIYKATETDTAWARRTLSLITEGGILAFPSTGLIYRVSHKDKTLRLINSEILLILFESYVVHRQTVAVMHNIGYTVVPQD